MATSTETVHSYPYPVTTVAAVLVDPDYLSARLAAIGGEQAALLSHKHDAKDNIVIVQRQGIPTKHLPSFVRAIVPGDIVIERAETWRTHGEGATCVVKATVSGAPATIEGSLDLEPDGPESCTLATLLNVRVSVPIVGGKVEKVVIEQLLRLLDKEHKFAIEWLSAHR
jgi:hypothetical protein